MKYKILTSPCALDETYIKWKPLEDHGIRELFETQKQAQDKIDELEKKAVSVWDVYKIEETKRGILSNFLWKMTGWITGILWAIAIMLGAYAAGL